MSTRTEMNLLFQARRIDLERSHGLTAKRQILLVGLLFLAMGGTHAHSGHRRTRPSYFVDCPRFPKNLQRGYAPLRSLLPRPVSGPCGGAQRGRGWPGPFCAPAASDQELTTATPRRTSPVPDGKLIPRKTTLALSRSVYVYLPVHNRALARPPAAARGRRSPSAPGQTQTALAQRAHPRRRHARPLPWRTDPHL